jgi:hypothetical protein
VFLRFSYGSLLHTLRIYGSLRFPYGSLPVLCLIHLGFTVLYGFPTILLRFSKVLLRFPYGSLPVLCLIHLGFTIYSSFTVPLSFPNSSLAFSYGSLVNKFRIYSVLTVLLRFPTVLLRFSG